MARRRSKKKAHKILKTVILSGIFAAIRILSLHPAVTERIGNTVRGCFPEQNIIQSVPAPVSGGKPPFHYTIKHPQYDNLSCGVPGPADTIVEREGYALGYIEKHEQSAWVQYVLTAEEVSRRTAKREGCFRPDPAIPTGSATPQDYARSGYDRGHLAPAADMSFSVKTMSESFYMSNMSPQAPQFNRGIWNKLEKQVRHFAAREKRIVVVTGPVLPPDKSITIGVNQVTVPRYYYKAIYDTTPPGKMIAFVLPNKDSSADLRSFAVTVDHVEELTGLDFFSSVPQPEQERLERTVTTENWEWIR